MKNFISLSCILLIPSFILATNQDEASPKRIEGKDIIEHAQYWAKQLPKLSHEETALLANFLYFSYLSSYYESAARSALIANHSQLIIMNRQLGINEADARATAMKAAEELMAFKKELLPLRSYSIKAWQACYTEIEKSEFTSLKKIVINLQQYSSAVISQFVKQDRDTAIDNIIKNCNMVFEKQFDVVKQCTESFQQILDNKNPHVKEDTDKDMADLTLALAAADTSLGCFHEMIMSALQVKSMSIDMININSIINITFYNTLYTMAKQDKKAMPLSIMFDENGLIKEEKRDELLPFLDENAKVSTKHISA